MEHYCKFCNKVIAPNDPHIGNDNGYLVHLACLKQHQKNLNCHVRPARQELLHSGHCTCPFCAANRAASISYHDAGTLIN